MSSKKRMHLIASLLFTIFPLAGKGNGTEPTLIATRLSERTMVLHGPGLMSPRMTVFASDKGLVVFDTLGTPSQAAAARRRIEKEFGRDDFVWVINTHDHWDHWCGNQVFPEATVVSHVSCPAEMRRPLEAASHPAPGLRETVEAWKKDLGVLDPGSENAARLRERIASFQSAHEELGRDFVPALPTLTFSSRLEIVLGRQTLKLYYTGGFETPDDIVAHVPEEGLVILGDTFQRGLYFAAFEKGIDVPLWAEIMTALLAGKVKYAVPGHGDPLAKDELAEIGKYLKISWEAVEAAVRQGLDASQTKERLSFESVRSRLDPSLIDLKGLEAVHAANVEAFWRRLLSGG